MQPTNASGINRIDPSIPRIFSILSKRLNDLHQADPSNRRTQIALIPNYKACLNILKSSTGPALPQTLSVLMEYGLLSSLSTYGLYHSYYELYWTQVSFLQELYSVRVLEAIKKSPLFTSFKKYKFINGAFLLLEHIRVSFFKPAIMAPAITLAKDIFSFFLAAPDLIQDWYNTLSVMGTSNLKDQLKALKLPQYSLSGYIDLNSFDGFLLGTVAEQLMVIRYNFELVLLLFKLFEVSSVAESLFDMEKFTQLFVRTTESVITSSKSSSCKEIEIKRGFDMIIKAPPELRTKLCKELVRVIKIIQITGERIDNGVLSVLSSFFRNFNCINYGGIPKSLFDYFDYYYFPGSKTDLVLLGALVDSNNEEVLRRFFCTPYNPTARQPQDSGVFKMPGDSKKYEALLFDIMADQLFALERVDCLKCS
ncbi:hypothetical protein PSN45_001743 [Yamadazyma tenuis]|uniref:uncharacterized protein n=1 Tax=Candida tenuis TaxID=2315449 RepID=UPI0027A13A7F|nr:hypothetical protein PSN45_001743 [Yamadazyma tenuis]